MKYLTNESPEERYQRAALLSEEVLVVLKACGKMNPDLDLLEDTLYQCSDKASFASNGAVILEALNINSEERQFEWNLREKRAKALLNLVRVLKQTEEDRLAYKLKQDKIANSRNQLLNFLGN